MRNNLHKKIQLATCTVLWVVTNIYNLVTNKIINMSIDLRSQGSNVSKMTEWGIPAFISPWKRTIRQLSMKENSLGRAQESNWEPTAVVGQKPESNITERIAGEIGLAEMSVDGQEQGAQGLSVSATYKRNHTRAAYSIEKNIYKLCIW